ncbi:AraC family transcriptional regulator [Haliea sp.]
MTRALELSATYARLVLQSERVPAAELLAGTGFTAASLATMDYVPWAALARLFRNYARRQPSPAWALELGAQFNIASHGPLGFAALSAPTLGAALEIMARYHPVRTNTMGAATHREAERFFLILEDLTGDPEFATWLEEIVFKVLESLLAAILGHPVGPNVVVAFTQPSPAHGEALTAGYDARVVFNAPVSSISIPAIWCQLPSPLHDEAVYRANIARCRDILASRDSRSSAAERVWMLLDSHFADSRRHPLPVPPLEQLAARLHLTPRTLIRRLQHEGTGYREIVEDLRREHATRLLRDARLNIGEVGEVLGYREQANFGRAFRRWFGCSPAAWRRQ